MIIRIGMNRVAAVIALVLFTVFPGCRHSGTGSAAPVVTVSIAPQEWMLRLMTGGDIDINTLLPPGSDPETFEPSMQAMRSLEESGEYAMVGTLPFEIAVRDRLQRIYPRLRITDATAGMFLLADTHHHHSHSGDAAHHEHDGVEDGAVHEHGGADPHVWTTPRNLRAMADALLATAVRANPGGAARYRRNHAALCVRIERLQRSMESAMRPLRGREVVIWHPSLTYLAHDFGFCQLAVQQGEKEPTPRRMADIIDMVREYRGVAMVVENEHSPRMSLALNEDMKLPVVGTSLMQPDIITTLQNLADGLGKAALRKPQDN